MSAERDGQANSHSPSTGTSGPDGGTPLAPGAREGLGKVWLVGAGPGEPDLITWRGADLLRQAKVVLHDALSHPELLDLCPRECEIIDVGKRYGKRATPQPAITEMLLQLSKQGKEVVRLKGGDPLVFARGSEEALALSAAGVPFELVPGITSSIAASAFAGISLTHRELSSSVTFITGSDREGKEWSPEAWEKLATATGTICIYMGMRRIDAIMRAIVAGGRAASTPAAAIQWGARPQQRTVVGSVETLAEDVRRAGLTSPAIIVVGEVVSLREQLAWYDKRRLFGRRILVARSHKQAGATARAIRRRSAAPVVRPAIEIVPSPEPEVLRSALGKLRSYDWVVFTSANGVHRTFQALFDEGQDVRAFGDSKIAVIGPKTADALREYRITPDLTAKKFVAESLLEGLLALGEKPQRVLLPRAAVARNVLPDALRAAGIEVDVVSAYATEAVRGDAQEALALALEQETDIVLFTSSSMVDSVVEALGEGAQELLSERLIACIGPITAATVRRHGLAVDVEASVYTIDGVLDALEEHYD